MWQGGYSYTVLCEELLHIVFIESDKVFFFSFSFIKEGNRHFLKKIFFSLSSSFSCLFKFIFTYIISKAPQNY